MLSLGSIFPKFQKTAVVSLEKGKEFHDITSEDHKNADKWMVMFWWPKDFTFVCPTEIAAFNEGAYNFLSDMSPDLRYDAKDSDPPYQKRKTIRGGSWKDVGYFLQVSTRAFEYQDTAKSYIGFRCVIDLAPKMDKK